MDLSIAPVVWSTLFRKLKGMEMASYIDDNKKSRAFYVNGVLLCDFTTPQSSPYHFTETSMTHQP